MYLSRREIEKIALRVTDAYEALEGGSAYRIEPVTLAEKLLGLSLDYSHSLSVSGAALGLTAFEPGYVVVYDTGVPCFFEVDGRTVLIERYLKENPKYAGRMNFTVAHEAAHHVLAMLFPEEYTSRGKYRVIYSMSGRAGSWEEWQANALASAMLLPEKQLRTAMRRFGLGEKLYRLNRVFEPDGYGRFSAMAVYFGVSKRALSIRMKQLGLLEQDYLDDPYRLIRAEVSDKEERSDGKSECAGDRSRKV